MRYMIVLFLGALVCIQPNATASIYYSAVAIEADGEVSFAMRKGPIKEQLMALLKSHPRLKDPKKLIWEAKAEQWPIDAAYKDKTIDGVINDVCKQVELKVTYYATGYIVVRDWEQPK